jgi:hypothetical protein
MTKPLTEAAPVVGNARVGKLESVMRQKPGNGPQVACLIGAEPRAARPE